MATTVEAGRAMSSEGTITYVGVAHPWMCDAMGHVNVRHYAAMFDDASFQFLGHVVGRDQASEAGLGWADVRCEIDYKHETPSGALITIRSHVETVGTSSLAYSHVMSGSIDGVVHAQARVVSVRFDLAARSKIALDDTVRANAMALLRRPAD